MIQGGDFSLIEESHPVAEGLCFGHVVGAKEDGLPLPPVMVNRGMDDSRRCGIQTAGWFIHDQHFRVVEQSPANEEPSFHPLGISSHRPLSCFGQVIGLEKFLYPGGRHAVERGKKAEILYPRKPVIKMTFFKDYPQMPVKGGILEGGLAQHPAGTAGGTAETSKDPDGGGFAGTVGAEITENFSRVYLKADPLECRSFSVFFTKFSTAMAGSVMAITVSAN